MTKSPPIRRNVSPSTEPPKDPEWFGKVTKVERQKSFGRKKRYRRVNPEEWEKPSSSAIAANKPVRRNTPRRTGLKRKLIYLFVATALLATGYLMAGF